MFAPLAIANVSISFGGEDLPHDPGEQDVVGDPLLRLPHLSDQLVESLDHRMGGRCIVGGHVTIVHKSEVHVDAGPMFCDETVDTYLLAADRTGAHRDAIAVLVQPVGEHEQLSVHLATP